MLPPELIQQFRQVALERIARIEESWSNVLVKLDDEASTVIHREVHTLKGESRVVGFTDVNLICHKLEDMLDVARNRGYAIGDDFDLAMTMVFGFLGMLVRKKAGTQNSIDLPGFIRQIDGVIKRHDRGRTRPGSVPPALRVVSSPRVSTALRETLGPPAVDAFLEFAVAKGPRRDRLRSSWHLLRDLIGIQRAVISAAQLSKYQPSAVALARDLGKQVEIHFDLETSEVTTEGFMAIDVAALHLIRNAVDHGIESPEARTRAGKRPVGTLTIRGGSSPDGFWFSVEDDGRGIDFEHVRAKAIGLGLLQEDAAADEARLVELMCHPGFSTRSEANEVSGRGVGLDAVRGSAVDIGGSLTAASKQGQGTTWTVTIPVPQLSVGGHSIRAPGLRFPIVVGGAWRLMERPTMPVVIDLGVALGLAPSNSISTSVWAFTNDELEVGLLCGGKPVPVQARRLVPTANAAFAEVCTVDSVEGLLLRPERIPGVLT